MCKVVLQKAVELAGGQTKLAAGLRARIEGCRIGQVTVWGWLNSARMAVPPAETVIPICEMLGWRITPHELRPDLYPNEGDGIPPGLIVEAA